MELKILAAVLVSLLIIGAGLDAYDMDVGDLTDVSEISEGLFDFFRPGRIIDEEIKGTTNVTVEFVSYDNFSYIEDSGFFEKIEVYGEDISVGVGGFQTQDNIVEITNLTGDVSIKEQDVHIEGRSQAINVGGREMVSNESEDTWVNASSISYIEVNDLSNVDLEFVNVTGSVGRQDQYIEMDFAPLKLYDFSGIYIMDAVDDEFNLEGVVTRGEFGKEDSKAIFGG